MSETVMTVTGRSAMANMAARFNSNEGELLDTLKNTVFKNATNAQLMTLCIVADQYKLNPFTREIYAFPDSKTGGIVPVVGVDGWLRIINEHPQFDGLDVVASSTECTVTIHRKDRQHPTILTEYMVEVRRNTAPWQSHPMRMLRHKTIIQCARAAFGYSGIKDPDEAERIIEAQVIETRIPVSIPVALQAAGKVADVTAPVDKSTTATTEDVCVMRGVIERIQSKDGKKPAGVKLNGEWYNTFDSKIEAEASTMIGADVVIEYHNKPYGEGKVNHVIDRIYIDSPAGTDAVDSDLP